METPHGGKSNDSSRWPQLQMVGLKTPRPPLVLRLRKLLIGSAEGAQIRLKSSTIDPLHAELIPSATGCLLRDLASSSGTFVNDVPMHETRLKEGDQIRVGRFVFRYSAPAAKEGPAAKAVTKAVKTPPMAAPRSKPSSPPARLEVKAKVEKKPAATTPSPAVQPGLASASCEAPSPGVKTEALAAIAPVLPVPASEQQPPLKAMETPPPQPSSEALAAKSASSGEEGALATVVTPPGSRASSARLRPTVGRRRRPRRPQEAAPSAQAQIQVAQANEAATDEETAEELLEPQTARGKAAGYFLLMLVCMAVASVLAWRYSPPAYVIRAAITFRNRSGEPLVKNQAYLDQQKALFLSDGVRAAAVKLLAHSKDHSTDNLDPGFLTDPSGLLAVGGVSWEGAAGRPGLMSLVYTMRSRLPETDTARASALIRAFADRRSASSKPALGDLKLRLLQAEVDELEREVAFRSHSPDQVRKQIEILENATPSEVEMNLMQKREASLRAAVESAMQDRIIAQFGAASDHSPATAPSTRGTTQPVVAGGKEQVVAKLQRQEAALQAEWAKAMRDLAEAKVRSQWLAEQKQKITSAQRDLPPLKDKLKQKSAELAEMKKSSAGVEVFALDDARVVEVQDQRGMHVGVAVAGVAVLFGLLMITAAQGRVAAPDQADR